MRILITGSNGLLGQKLIDRLIGIPEIEVLASSMHENCLPFHSGYQFARMDISNMEQVRQVVEHFCPDVIVNTAAISHADVCEENRELCRNVNVLGVKNLVTIANEQEAHLVHLSTDFVFDGQSGPYSETDPVGPLNYYGQSKLESEQWVQKHCKNWAIIRTVLVYGVNTQMSRSNLVLWVKNSLEEGKAIRVVEDQYRTPTLVEDLVDGVFRIVNLKAKGLYNISGEEWLSVYDIAQRIARYFYLPTDLIAPIATDELGEKARRPLRTGFHIEKAKSELGFQPVSLEEGLEIVSEQLKILER